VKYNDGIERDARLIILRELALQVDGQLNEISLRRALDIYGITRSRDWIVTQLNRLSELGAISIKPAGEVLVAALTPAGRDHVDERSILGGVSRPHELGG
jgi:hypothetical protein